ncbi:hypothetical protein SAMN05444421_11267 [Celeribacter marinus]|uniref:Uncharacterized protein n=1 Tax=Celeribacter marinus TaxID=1397108 RepID=A0A0N9ZM86_9RHOB|nr:hypothetical protein IMCC12053_2888 [Celeribacter marinus]SFK99328.1 hypothetical protein SAMN05444421_11267 [Celeribacter marinus]
MSTHSQLTALRIAYLSQRWGVTPERAVMLAAIIFGEARG